MPSFPFDSFSNCGGIKKPFGQNNTYSWPEGDFIVNKRGSQRVKVNFARTRFFLILSSVPVVVRTKCREEGRERIASCRFALCATYVCVYAGLRAYGYRAARFPYLFERSISLSIRFDDRTEVTRRSSGLKRSTTHGAVSTGLEVTRRLTTTLARF